MPQPKNEAYDRLNKILEKLTSVAIDFGLQVSDDERGNYEEVIERSARVPRYLKEIQGLGDQLRDLKSASNHDNWNGKLERTAYFLDEACTDDKVRLLEKIAKLLAMRDKESNFEFSYEICKMIRKTLDDTIINVVALMKQANRKLPLIENYRAPR